MNARRPEGRVAHLLAALAAIAALSGCAVPEARLRSGLTRAGVPPSLAACMAERMVDRLSLAQLTRLSDLPAADESRDVTEFLRRVRALRDPEILAVTSSSAALCATGIAR